LLSKAKYILHEKNGLNGIPSKYIKKEIVNIDLLPGKE